MKVCYRNWVEADLITIRQSTFDLLQAFVSAGGALLAAGGLPDRIDGEPSDELREFCGTIPVVANTTEALIPALRDAVVPAGRRGNH